MNMNMKAYLLSLLIGLMVFSLSSMVFAGHPDCSGVERWATAMAFVHLNNAKVTNNDKVDFNKTKTVRLASEKIGNDLYTQIHHLYRHIEQKHQQRF